MPTSTVVILKMSLWNLPLYATMLQNECTKGSNLSRTAGSQKKYLYCWLELRDYCIYITRKSVFVWAGCGCTHRLHLSIFDLEDPTLGAKFEWSWVLVMLILWEWKSCREIMGSEYGAGWQRGKRWGIKMWEGSKSENCRRKRGWGGGEVALMLRFIPKPTLLGSPDMSTHTITHTDFQKQVQH